MSSSNDAVCGYRVAAGVIVMVTTVFVRLKVFICIDHILHVLRAQQMRVKPAVCRTWEVALRQEVQALQVPDFRDV